LNFTAATRRMYDKLAAEELARSASPTLRLAGGRTRRRFAEAFVAVVNQHEKPTKEQYREECRRVGISPALIFLLLSIAWDVLWHWWQNRDDL
jgi:hypothetical protein